MLTLKQLWKLMKKMYTWEKEKHTNHLTVDFHENSLGKLEEKVVHSRQRHDVIVINSYLLLKLKYFTTGMPWFAHTYSLKRIDGFMFEEQRQKMHIYAFSLIIIWLKAKCENINFFQKH